MRKTALASIAFVVVSGVLAFAQEAAKPANSGGAAVAPAITITPETQEGQEDRKDRKIG